MNVGIKSLGSKVRVEAGGRICVWAGGRLKGNKSPWSYGRRPPEHDKSPLGSLKRPPVQGQSPPVREKASCGQDSLPRISPVFAVFASPRMAE